jgi:hypothetical protein
MFSIYLKFRGLSAKAFDMLHALGITMSHKWTCDAVDKMSKSAMDAIRSLIQHFPWFLSYDNINIAFRVFSQRLEKNTDFGCGTAGTVYIKPNAKPLSEEANRALKAGRARGLKNPITAAEIIQLRVTTYPTIHAHMVHEVLRFLLHAPEFDLSSYPGKSSIALAPPPSVRKLPCGRENITRQAMLGTVNIPEASYGDNLSLVFEWLKQLGFTSTADYMKIGIEKVLAWCGDQLTVDRLRGLFKFRASDSNSFQRFDWMIPVPGWFHLQMAFANSLHKQYLGTTKGKGLRRAFGLLQRKGLQSTATKGPFHHNLEEALYHVAEAHIRLDWRVVGNVTNLRDLRDRSPEALRQLAEKLVNEHASSTALNAFARRHGTDTAKQQTIMFNRDVLHYIVLDKAIKHGDVGFMENMLPYLVTRFAGGKNTNYTTEALELLQGVHKDWPEEVKIFLEDNCWLANMAGHPDSFIPIDQVQEHNIKDIKVYSPSLSLKTPLI